MPPQTHLPSKEFVTSPNATDPPAASGLAQCEPGNPTDMQHIDSRKMAVAGVLASAVIASCLTLPAVDQLSTIEGTWLAAAILCLPTAALLAATGYRHYGLARSVGVAVAIMLFTGVITWVVAVFALASAMSLSTVGPVIGVLMLCAP